MLPQDGRRETSSGSVVGSATGAPLSAFELWYSSRRSSSRSGHMVPIYAILVLQEFEGRTNRSSVVALLSKSNLAQRAAHEHTLREVADRLCDRVYVLASAPQEVHLVGPIHFFRLPASEMSARVSPAMSACEMVFSSTKITPPWDRSSSAQSFSNGGIVLRS